MSPTTDQIRQARTAAGLTQHKAADILRVHVITWQRWEGKTTRTTEMPFAYWHLFLLLTGQHPKFQLQPKSRSTQ